MAPGYAENYPGCAARCGQDAARGPADDLTRIDGVIPRPRLGESHAMSSNETPLPEKAPPAADAARRPPERRKRNIPVALDRRGDTETGERRKQSQGERRRQV